ncbi:sulfotransferase [Actinokineospora enzanensis]|uniref:sulfotransferase n=1 Tax=Actinokineospora enzanensis TaxID=155975 RepID=UPI000361F524|nr:sulfotransferase [Actinokineospora enzanensis]
MIDSTERVRQLLTDGAEDELGRAELAPDGRYQLRPTTLASMSEYVSRTLADGFAGRGPAEFPLLVVGWGKCRVGSTALTNLFGVAGVPAYYQPVKTIARHAMTGGQGAPWRLPDGQDVLFAKEMAGPYVHYETLFDPIRCLVDAGWPAERLHLLVLDREPVASLNSWLVKWTGKIGRQRVLDNFELSSLNYPRMRARAREVGVAVTHFAYEASRSPALSVSRLFDRLGIAHRYDDTVISDWGARGDLNSDTATIVYPDEPEPYFVPGLHSSGDGYSYRRTDQVALTPADEELARRADIEEIYRTSVRECARALDLADLVDLPVRS